MTESSSESAVIDFTTDIECFDFPLIQKWLASEYWSPGISLERVIQGFRASTVVCAAFNADRQIGVARALSDTTRFAYLADVYVEPDFRGKGVARKMVSMILEHPMIADVDSSYLLTDDAQGLYEKLGFKVPELHGKLMRRRRED